MKMRSSRLAAVLSIKGFIIALFCLLAVGGGLIVVAPFLNPYFGPQSPLGKENFFLLKLFGISREQAFIWTSWFIFNWLTWIVFGVCLYRFLAIGVARTPGEVRFVAVARSFWELRSRAAGFLFGIERPEPSRNERVGAAIVGVFFLAMFAIMFSKNEPYLKDMFDIRWHMAFLDYDIAWQTPVFSLSANILYYFDMQVPFNTILSPLNGTAHLVSPNFRIVTSFTLFYLAMSVLLWAVGCAAGLRPVARAVFAGLTALIVTLPFGLDHLLPFLPSFPFVTQAMLTRYWEEVGILSLTTVFLFFWIGQCRTAIANVAIGMAFSVVCYIVLLAYPALAFFSAQIIILYCFAFLATAPNAKEFWWKVAVSSILFATMLAAQIPVFFRNLYSYSLGAYFVDRIMNADNRLIIWKNSTIATTFWYDSRVPLLCLLSFCTALFFIVRGRGAMRRIAIAMLVCEAGIVTIGAVIAYLHVPISLYYSDQLQVPILAGFFVLPLMLVAVIFLARSDAIFQNILEQAKERRIVRSILVHRRKWYSLLPVLVLAYSLVLIPTEPRSNFSNYPPAYPPSVQILDKELGLKPGKAFGGRVLAIVQQEFPAATGPDMSLLWTAVRNVLEGGYGRYTGNDHWIDLLNLNIPVAGEYSEWTTPINFVFLREFFGRKDDLFEKALFILRTYNDRVARMIGVRYVVTDAASVPGATLAYQEMAGDAPLRLFRVERVNLGQYSPTRLTQISTAADGLAAIKSSSFDPEQDALVEEEPPANLVSGKLQSLTVEAGPTLHIQAESLGTSLLVLPFEYSYCIRLDTEDSTSARLIPVNLQQIGLLFDRHAKVKIFYRFGLFDQVHCRGDDLERADRLRLREAL